MPHPRLHPGRDPARGQRNMKVTDGKEELSTTMRHWTHPVAACGRLQDLTEHARQVATPS